MLNPQIVVDNYDKYHTHHPKRSSASRIETVRVVLRESERERTYNFNIFYLSALHKTNQKKSRAIQNCKTPYTIHIPIHKNINKTNTAYIPTPHSYTPHHQPNPTPTKRDYRIGKFSRECPHSSVRCYYAPKRDSIAYARTTFARAFHEARTLAVKLARRTTVAHTYTPVLKSVFNTCRAAPPRRKTTRELASSSQRPTQQHK